jgi:hypothetical protein
MSRLVQTINSVGLKARFSAWLICLENLSIKHLAMRLRSIWKRRYRVVRRFQVYE